MELKSFREILLKKADGNPYLQTLIEYTKDELIADEVIESLLKMAEPSAAMGRGANHAVTSYAAGMKPVHVEQLRDALGHHISHYRGALKAHHAATDPTEKQRLRHVADLHLNKVVPLLHLAGRASKHSGGQMVLDYPSMTPWETNYTGTKRLPNGKLKEGTKDLGRRPAPSANRERNPHAVPDYRYLEMPPHPGHAMSSKMHHKGGYPFEEVQLGHPMKRDAGQAYLPIENMRAVKDFVPHPFDAHPVHGHADKSQHDLTPEHHEQINAGLAGWTDSEPHKQWLADLKAKHTADPEAFKTRGNTKPAHVYEGLPLGEMEHHKAEAPAEAPAAEAAPKKEAKAKEEPASDFDKFFSTLSDKQKKEMMANPAFKQMFEKHGKG